MPSSATIVPLSGERATAPTRKNRMTRKSQRMIQTVTSRDRHQYATPQHTLAGILFQHGRGLLCADLQISAQVLNLFQGYEAGKIFASERG